MLLFVLLYAFVFRSGDIQLDIYHDVISAGLYVYNIAWAWGWSMHEVMLYHTWSLGVEEQFYLIWPFILYFCIKRKAFKSLQIILVLFIAATWILKSYNLYPFIAGSIIKESIFIGCAGALLRWNGFQIKISTLVAFLLLIVLILMGIAPFKIPYYDTAFNVCSILTVFIIWHVVQNQQSKITEILSNKTIVFIGKISYSLYLWHLPVFRIFAFHSTLPSLVSFTAKFIISFAFAILSWFTVEKITTAWGRKMSKKMIESKRISAIK
jgi:peptidoglycan/LPS O-acetylase OafA/YrhL